MPDFAQYFIGADLGQDHDFTGISVIERAEVPGEFDHGVFATRKNIEITLRYLTRVPLGTPYPEVVERVQEVTEMKEIRGRCRLIVDATGVGTPVVDMLRAARLSCGMMPVKITPGHTEREDEHGYHLVPKLDLITGLKIVFQQKKLRIAGGMEYGETLIKEMQDMRVKISPNGNEQFGAWREGTHDDLVLSVALAWWGVKKIYPNEPQGDDRYFKRLLGQPDLRKALGDKWRP
jgi:hypothetical protein